MPRNSKGYYQNYLQKFSIARGSLVRKEMDPHKIILNSPTNMIVEDNFLSNNHILSINSYKVNKTLKWKMKKKIVIHYHSQNKSFSIKWLWFFSIRTNFCKTNVINFTRYNLTHIYYQNDPSFYRPDLANFCSLYLLIYIYVYTHIYIRLIFLQNHSTKSSFMGKFCSTTPQAYLWTNKAQLENIVNMIQLINVRIISTRIILMHVSTSL